MKIMSLPSHQPLTTLCILREKRGPQSLPLLCDRSGRPSLVIGGISSKGQDIYLSV